MQHISFSVVFRNTEKRLDFLLASNINLFLVWFGGVAHPKKAVGDICRFADVFFVTHRFLVVSTAGALTVITV